MSAFTVTVFQLDQAPFTYSAIGTDSSALAMAAQDDHGPCGVFVTPA